MKRNYFKNSQKFAICEIRKIPNENTTFFPGKLYQEVFCFTLLLRLWYSIPRLVWFGQLLDPMKKTFFYISFFAKFKKFRMKYLIFSGKGIQNFFCFTLSLHSWYCTPSLVWFGQLPVPIKKNYFLNSQKFALREIRKIPYENPIFFPRQAIPNTLFALHCHYTGDIQYRVWFDLDNSLTRWKKEIFLKLAKICNSRNSQNSVWKPIFSRQAIPTTFLLYTVITLVILHAEFGLIWITPSPDEKELF